MKRSGVTQLRDVISVSPSVPDVRCVLCGAYVGRGSVSKVYLCADCHEAITNKESDEGKSLRRAVILSRSNRTQAKAA